MSTDSDSNDKSIRVRDPLWTPWEEFGLFDFDRIFRRMSDMFMRPFEGKDILGEEWRAPLCEMDYDKENDEIRLVLEMPGINKDEIKVHVNGKSIQIKGESENRRYMRSYSFPRELDPDKTRASFNNGILEITLGMHEEDMGHLIDVE